MLNSSIKKIALFLIFTYLFLLKSGETTADLFAERKISRNRLTATTLNLTAINSLNNLPQTELFNVSGLNPGGFAVASLKIKGESSGRFKYYFRIIKISGDEAFCQQLNLQIFNRSLNEKYNGPLLATDVRLPVSTSGDDDWIFLINLDNNQEELKNKVCEFALDVKTYYDDPSETGGVFAQQQIKSAVISGGW